MRMILFIPGVILFFLGFIVWAYDQPKIDLFSQGIGQIGLLNEAARENFQTLQEEVFMAKIGMALGVIIMIPGIVLKKKQKKNPDNS